MARKVTQLSEVNIINDNDSFLIETNNGSRQVKGFILKRLVKEAKLSISQFDPNDGKIPPELLSDKVLEMIAGTSPVSPTLDDYSITHNKLSLGSISEKNLDNNLQAVLCKLVETDKDVAYLTGYYNASNGAWVGGTGTEGSKLISVEPGEEVVISTLNTIPNSCFCVFFDNKSKFVSSYLPSDPNNVYEVNHLVKVPAGCFKVGISTANKNDMPIVVQRKKIVNFNDLYRDLNTKVDENKAELDNTNNLLDGRVVELETKMDDIGDFQVTRDAISDLNYDVDQLEARVSETEKENPFAWKQFDKAQVLFMIDTGSRDLPEVYATFKKYDVPVNLGVPSSYLDNTLSDGTKLIDTLKTMVGVDKCEVLSQSIDGNVFMLNTPEEEAERRLRKSKQDLVKAGFDVNGFVKPMGEGSLASLVIFEHLVKRYYRYGILSGKTAPFNIQRIPLNDTLENLKNKVEEAIVNETFVVFYCSDMNSINVDVLEGLIQYVIIQDRVKVSTFKQLYDNYRSTTLANKIAAGIDIDSLLEVNQVNNEDKLVIQTANGPKKILKSNFDNVLKPFEYSYSIWYPSDFPQLPFRVYKDINGKYQHEFNIRNEFIGKQIYVACESGRGSDSNDGLTPETAVLSLKKAIEVANSLKNVNNVVINVMSNMVERTFGPLSSNFTLENNIVIRPMEGKEVLFTSAVFGLEWEDYEGGIYQTYQTTALNVSDNLYRDLDDKPMVYKKLPTINAVVENPGSYFISDTNYIYVNTIDGRRPDKDILVNTSTIPSIWNINNKKLVFSNISFMMSHVNADQVRVNGNEKSTLVNYGCKFIGAGNHGLLTSKVGRVYSFDTISCENKGHGFNYRTVLTQGPKDLIFEFNCKSYNNGKLMSGVISGSCAQDGLNIIRINTYAHSCDGPLCSDSNGCYSLMYGCSMCNSLRNSGSTNTGFWFDSDLSQRTHKAYLIDCAGDSEFSLNADVMGEIYLRHFQGIKIPEPIKRLITYI